MGHISPLLSIYENIKNDYEIIYFGLKNSMEEEVCKRLNIKFVELDLYPFFRKNIFKNIITINKLLKEIRRIKKEFKKEQIKAIISSGGYVSFPLVYAFKNNHKIKKLLIEPNSVFGLANKLLISKVDYVCTQFITSTNKKFIKTGNPIEISNPTFDHSSFYLNKELILFLGGSNGALEIVKLAYDFNCNYPEIKIFVITGDKYYETYKFNTNAHVYKRINNISSIFKFFKIIVSRSGASTLTEIILTNSVSILMPSKNVVANHQYKNAMFLKNKNACYLIENYSKESYIEVYNLLHNTLQIDTIKKNIFSLKAENSVENVVNLMK